MSINMTDTPNLDEFVPKFNPWFISEIVYEGQGIASFENPKGEVLGKTTIMADELGDLSVEMKFEHLNTNIEISSETETFRILKFLYRQFSKQDTVAINGNRNPCSKLVVETDNGIFTSDRNISWSTIEIADKIVFWIHSGIFKVRQAKDPKYWVVPLTNFVASFPSNNHPILAKHPLRLYSTPDVPEMEDAKHRLMARFTANRRNHLIGFEFGETFGYIEPLPDFVNREKQLKSGEKRRNTTALMVGGISTVISQYWFPHDYTKLLTFATGTEVGASWLEYRDEWGGLVSRKHFPSLDSCYTKGYSAIEDSLGKLISLASKFSEFNETYFRVFLNQMSHLALSFHYENRMMILSRTFEGLYEHLNKIHGLWSKNLMVNLPDSYKTEVTKIIREAKSKMMKLSRKANKEGLSEEVVYSVERIAKRLNDVNNTDDDFGTKALRMLNWYKMPDADIMEKYYQDTKGISWAGYLSKMRNDPIHDGYFSIQDGTHDSDEISNAQDHLHDILARIMLKILNYDGEYKSKVKDHRNRNVDWVTETASAHELGYEQKRGI